MGDNSSLAKNLLDRGMSTRPLWAHGATILVQGLTSEVFQHSAGQKALSELRPWHVIVLSRDVLALKAALQASLSHRRRPREKKSRRTTFTLSKHGLNANCQSSSYAYLFKFLPQTAVGSLHSNCDAAISSGVVDEKFPVIELVSDEGLEPSDRPIFIDEETAALIQHEQWASAVES